MLHFGALVSKGASEREMKIKFQFLAAEIESHLVLKCILLNSKQDLYLFRKVWLICNVYNVLYMRCTTFMMRKNKNVVYFNEIWAHEWLY